MAFFTNILGKLTSLVLQIIVVVVAVLLFSFFDPFKIFAPAVPTLENTPVSLKSIQSIGQLITAEYYGEVLVSLHGKYIEEIKVESEAFTEKASTLKEDFKYAAKILQEQDSVRFRGFNKRDQIKRYFHNAFPALTGDPDYNAFLEALMKAMDERSEESLLKRIWKEKLEIPDIENVKPEDFKEFKKKELEDQFADNLTRKKQLVLLGRGWVKAGFDFENFTKDDFRYDATNRVVHFIGLEPKLLSCVINPWFIPEKGVKGFEIISSTNKCKPEQVLETKRAALEQLRKQALERDILNQALENAKESLQEFFSLLLDTEVREVVFHTSEMDYQYERILGNDTISEDELVLIDSILYRNHGKKTWDEAIGFVDSLKKRPVCYLGSCSKFANNRYASIAYVILKDGQITESDAALLGKAYAAPGRLTWQDSIWGGLKQETKNSAEEWAKISKALKASKCADLEKLKRQVTENRDSSLQMAPGVSWPVLDCK